MVLEHVFHGVINVNIHMDKWWIAPKGTTPTALFHANHTLTQGSLHYRLATLDYRKRNTDGVETFIL